MGIGASALVEAGNYLTARLAGRSLSEARQQIEREIGERRSELDTLASKVVEAGLAVWGNDQASDEGVLIVRGHAKLLQDVTSLADLERIRALFDLLETKKNLLRLIELCRAPRACRSSSAPRTSCSA